MSFVYALLDPRKKGKFQYGNLPIAFLFEPFYIGKGKSKYRPYVHLKESLQNTGNPYKVNKIMKIQKETSQNPYTIKLYDWLSEEEAAKKEKFVINLIGRGKRGPLTNLTDGGEGLTGYKHTPTALAAIVESNKKRVVTDLTKKRISEGVKNSGCKLSEKDRIERSIRMSGSKNFFYNKRNFGKDNHNYGKTLPEYQRQILSKLAKEKIGSKNPNNKYIYCLYSHRDKQSFHNITEITEIIGWTIPIIKKNSLYRYGDWVILKRPKKSSNFCACELLKEGVLISAIPKERTKRISAFLKQI